MSKLYRFTFPENCGFKQHPISTALVARFIALEDDGFIVDDATGDLIIADFCKARQLETAPGWCSIYGVDGKEAIQVCPTFEADAAARHLGKFNVYRTPVMVADVPEILTVLRDLIACSDDNPDFDPNDIEDVRERRDAVSRAKALLAIIDTGVSAC